MGWRTACVCLLVALMGSSARADPPDGDRGGRGLIGVLDGEEPVELDDMAHRRLATMERLGTQDYASESEALAEVNRFFNWLPYRKDIDQWQATDYWATPREFLVSNGGDCEDYAIAKLMTLERAGIPAERLRLLCARALRPAQMHMVLAVFAGPDDHDPLILDNLTADIVPLSERDDLIPLYAMNADDFLIAGKKNGHAHFLPATRPSLIRWRELKQRLAAEQAGD